MPRLTAIDPAVANGAAASLLDTVQKKIGMTPNLLRTLANEPAALQGYLSLGENLATGQFDARTREAIALTVAGANRCAYCASAHTAISKSLNVDDDEIVTRLDGRSTEPELDAILIFARKIVEKRGLVDDADLNAVRSAGHSDGAIIEIVANVAANILTNYVNHIAQTDIDFPIVEFARARAA